MDQSIFTLLSLNAKQARKIWRRRIIKTKPFAHLKYLTGAWRLCLSNQQCSGCEDVGFSWKRWTDSISGLERRLVIGVCCVSHISCEIWVFNGYFEKEKLLKIRYLKFQIQGSGGKFICAKISIISNYIPQIKLKTLTFPPIFKPDSRLLIFSSWRRLLSPRCRQPVQPLQRRRRRCADASTHSSSLWRLFCEPRSHGFGVLFGRLEQHRSRAFAAENVLASELMKMNSGHYVSLIIPLLIVGGENSHEKTVRYKSVKLLRPSDTLVLGRASRPVTTQGYESAESKEISKMKKNLPESAGNLKMNLLKLLMVFGMVVRYLVVDGFGGVMAVLWWQ
ncbi:uncharacterized protein LOC111398156 [Olea europaea var. sylvestris]|uniref:uncharacterized protein LOC111398156 n=1 Tax=Olea europaea var. sylvestris TaxID=158386 RepID=UPI000C1D750C|nr:uncharacterized protein LOC111398156 [Olea europaea var. sylvestris]